MDLEERFGRVDGLVNNAAIQSRQRIGDIDPAGWRRVLDVNVTGPMLGIQTPAAAAPGGRLDRQRRVGGRGHGPVHARLRDEQMGRFAV